MKTVLLLGQNGQVGHALLSRLEGFSVTATNRATLDLTRPEALREAVRALRPHAIVNAAAYTAVDKAESEPGLARQINAVAPGVLAEEAARIGALLVHYSTDYVFDGTSGLPYTEDDTPNPLNVYGQTKWEGEQAVAAAGGDHLILRTSWVYGRHGHNFLNTMLRLAGEGRTHFRVVADQVGCPTWSGTIADATVRMLEAWQPGDGRGGLYHLSSEGQTTWHGFAEAIFAAVGRKGLAVEPIPTEAYPLPAARPRYSVLSKEKLSGRWGIAVNDWCAALQSCVHTDDA